MIPNKSNQYPISPIAPTSPSVEHFFENLSLFFLYNVGNSGSCPAINTRLPHHPLNGVQHGLANGRRPCDGGDGRHDGLRSVAGARVEIPLQRGTADVRARFRSRA